MECYNDTQGSATSARRGIGLFNNKTSGLIRDEITLGKATDNTVYWHMVTPYSAGVTIESDTANNQFKIAKNGKTLYVKYKVIGTGTVTASVEECQPFTDTSLQVLPRAGASDNDNNDAFRMLRIKVGGAPAENMSIIVKLTFNLNDSLPETPTTLNYWALEQ